MELLAKQNAEKIKNGIPGTKGTTIPKTPITKEIEPTIKNNSLLIIFIGITNTMYIFTGRKHSNKFKFSSSQVQLYLVES